MRLVLCDDNRLLGEALAAALLARGHDVLAVTASTAEAVSAVAVHKPDACLLDLYFPEGPSGIDAARAITQQSPSTRILVISGISDPVLWSLAVQAGITGFLRKDQSVSQISDALDIVESGGLVFDPLVTRGAVPRTRRLPLGASAPYGLSPREQEVLSRIAAGQGTRQIAAAMHLTVSTVRAYVKSVLTKLGVHSRLCAAAVVFRDGLDGFASISPNDRQDRSQEVITRRELPSPSR